MLSKHRVAAGVGLAILLVLVLLVVNAIVSAHQTRAAKADVGRVLCLDGADLQVTDDGPKTAPTLVLLHGWTESLHVWDPDLAGLGKRLRVIRVDLPGSGGSEAPVSGYSIPDQARQVARALDALGVRRAVVAGHSMGGDVAVELAAMRPGLVSGLVLIDSPTASGHTSPGFLVNSSLWPILGPFAHNFAPDFVKRQALSVAVAPGSDVPEQMVEDVGKVPWPAYEKQFHDTNDWVAEESVPRRLIGAHIPILVIWGNKDQLVSPDSVSLYRGLPNTRVVILPGIGHTPPLESPTRTAALLRGFAQGKG